MSNSIDTTVETIIIFYKCRGSLSYRKIIVAVLLFYIYCSSLILQTLLKLWFFSATDTELSDSTDTTAVPIPQFYILYCANSFSPSKEAEYLLFYRHYCSASFPFYRHYNTPLLDRIGGIRGIHLPLE